jgi:hypothetical protein
MRLPTPMTFQTWSAVLPELSSSTLSSRNLTTSVRGRPPVFPRALAESPSSGCAFGPQLPFHLMDSAHHWMEALSGGGFRTEYRPAATIKSISNPPCGKCTFCTR